jgi:hypothetical protein
MTQRNHRISPILGAIVLALVAIIATRRVASSFTQSGVGLGIGSGIPMGHEWITRLAALELLGGDPIMQPDPDDPRKDWTRGKAKNTRLDDAGAQSEVARLVAQPWADHRYQSTYKAVYDAIVGERWVDIGGFNVSKSHVGPYNCWDAVAQEAVEAQYDHFMRRFDERGAEGGVLAARHSRNRFIQYFVEAAMAPPTLMKVWDGGGYSALVEVDRNYFLFGRAAHLFQDSFSPEHTVRIADDNYERVRQVKSYLCAAGSEQHSHANSAVMDYTSGDVIWKPGTRLQVGWPSYKPSNMKIPPLVAIEATKDLWAAFIRTMGVPPARRSDTAMAEATRLAENWLAMDEAEALAWYDDESHRDSTYVLADRQTGKGHTVPQCMKGLNVGTENQVAHAAALKQAQRTCLYNIVSEVGYSDLFDRPLHMPFNWAWRNQLKWETPPSDWKIPDRPSDTGVRVRIKSAANGQYMTAPDGIADNSLVYCRAGAGPLEFIRVGSRDDAVYRLANASLFLSYRAVTGAVKLYSSPSQANYRLEQVRGQDAIVSLYWKQYMWLSQESPYITRSGNPRNSNARWVIEER